jgi:hypothetical protein
MKVGQEVYLRPNRIRFPKLTPIRDKVKEIHKGYIITETHRLFVIGRKAVYNWEDYILYTDFDLMQADIETERLTKEISDCFSGGEPFELGQLQQIARIMGLSRSAEKTNDKKE